MAARKALNKTELIEKIASSTSLTKSSASSAVNLVFDTITSTLKKGNSVSIPNFGSFDVVKRKARNGRNPQTGETIKIKATKAPRFKAGKGLKDATAGKR
ncbi:MAG: HU family DNA-binding protein [Candidatus Brocadiales bacterium]|nr:HU family DNA-binding protein [Candidatus Brocadiales bacterium]